VGGQREHLPLAVLVVALLVWPLAAFGGRSAATAVSFGVACLVLAALARPRLGGRLDRSLLALLTVVALPLIPLPASVVALVSPHAAAARRALSIDGGTATGWSLLTLSASDTGWAWIVSAGATAYFWIARAQFRRGGVRFTVRMVSAIGLGLSLLAIAQAATAGRDIYWRFRTEFEGPLPFGPFVNRNHFATWVIMALPLCLSYLAARSATRAKEPEFASPRSRLARAIDPRTAWLMAAAATMAVAVLLSLSRSGALALGVSGAATVLLCRRRLTHQRGPRVLAMAALVVVCGLAWADIPALRGRLAGAPAGLANRMTIWRETIPIVRDFPLTGTGPGTYQRAMFVYQRSTRDVYFNQAHNHYLQVAAEGGALLVAVVTIALVAFVRAARERLTTETSGLFWMRAGAACGLGAVALQSVWETGLVMPANATLAALLAAIVIHDRPRHECKNREP
jgi:O-Antigen ligase